MKTNDPLTELPTSLEAPDNVLLTVGDSYCRKYLNVLFSTVNAIGFLALLIAGIPVVLFIYALVGGGRHAYCNGSIRY